VLEKVQKCSVGMVVSSVKGDIYEDNLEELEERRLMYKKIRGKDNVSKERCFKGTVSRDIVFIFEV
jgi:hypothetical protein